MSLLTQASLVVTPSAYKEGKLYSVIPSDGSGDMSVVRATTATRVNSAGLVELVPYNLLSYSEQFDNAAWSKTSLSVSANSTTAPNGLNTADTLSNTSASAIILQASPSVNTSAVVTFSAYFKRTNNDWVNVAIARNGATTYGELYVWFNIATGAVGSNLPDGAAVLVDADIEDAGNGWYRCSVTGYVPNAVAYTAFMFFPDANSSFNRVTSQSVYAWGAQLNEGSTALPYQKTETRLNIPRLDYSNGTCPSLLVEPQRTNRLIYSEQLIQGKAWAYTSGSFTVTENTTDTLDPFGNNNADKFNATTQSNNDSYTTTSGSGSLTLSIFAKKGTNDSIQLYHDNVLSGGAFAATFNLTSGTITASSGTANIEDIGNGWFRCSVSGTDSNSAGNIHGVTTYTGTTYLFGVQLEQGSYPTSYIPTTSASVTRNADVISKTGISSLIGQTEGVMFADFVCDGFEDYGTPLSINDGTASNYIWLTTFANGNIRAEVYNGSVQASITYTGGVVGQRYKVAFAYKQNDFVMYVNGTQIGADASGNVPPSLSRIDYNLVNNWSLALLNVNATALWKTRLTNDQLEQLTGIGFNTYAEMANYYNYTLQ